MRKHSCLFIFASGEHLAWSRDGSDAVWKTGELRSSVQIWTGLLFSERLVSTETARVSSLGKAKDSELTTKRGVVCKCSITTNRAKACGGDGLLLVGRSLLARYRLLPRSRAFSA